MDNQPAASRPPFSGWSEGAGPVSDCDEPVPLSPFTGIDYADSYHRPSAASGITPDQAPDEEPYRDPKGSLFASVVHQGDRLVMVTFLSGFAVGLIVGVLVGIGIVITWLNLLDSFDR
jgi:hypothetical protein